LKQQIGQAAKENGAFLGTSLLRLRGKPVFRGRVAMSIDEEDLERFDNSVVHARSDLLNGFVAAVGPGAVRQQSDAELALGVDPKRSAGIAQMPK
jgi:hypothetical protein